MANIKNYYGFDYGYNESNGLKTLLEQCGAELNQTPTVNETNEKQFDAFRFETNSEQTDLDLFNCNCLNH